MNPPWDESSDRRFSADRAFLIRLRLYTLPCICKKSMGQLKIVLMNSEVVVCKAAETMRNG